MNVVLLVGYGGFRGGDYKWQWWSIIGWGGCADAVITKGIGDDNSSNLG